MRHIILPNYPYNKGFTKIKIYTKMQQFLLTIVCVDDKILLVAEVNEADMERYRSGHNEAVLKTVCPQGRVGSNPTLSVK